MKLSVCLATFNEAKNIHYALDSTINWVDEVIIVDGGSTDNTVALAKTYGAKVNVITTTNPPIFHINKQKAIEAATGDWILQLDADEEVTDNLRAEIERIANSEWQIADAIAYQIPRRNYFLGRFLMKGGVYPDYTIRLYKRGTMYFPCKDVHENVIPVQSTEYKVQSEGWLGTLENPMNHYSDPTFARYWHRWKRYCAIEASRVEENALRLYKDTRKYLAWKIVFIFKCIFILPIYWFFLSYFRHKGFMDGWQGFVFHFMSALRWWGIAIAVWRQKRK
ncbi:MAG TPA: glycosyltransferase family 2 protein [Candidatus Woesebacteria bacterium]|nr:glycosyltransferase family 2 protein [Candidatus Woesebacteria bacterium]HNS95043.1 glycosyltransferase family 2 protein [Candidatus Woesebacteria bacterium]